MTTQQNEKFYVYRFLDKTNTVIYTGRTNDLETRLLKHFRSKDKNHIKRNKKTTSVEYVIFDKKTYCALYEIFLINLWKPEFNIDSKYNEEIDPNLLNIEKLNWTSIDSAFIDELKEKIYVRKTISSFRNFSNKELERFETLEERLGLTLGKSEKIVLAIMWRAKEINHTDVDTPFLLQKGKFSRSTLKRITAYLRDLGLIQIENNRDEIGQRVSFNKYYLTEGGGI